ncbi:MAG: NADH-quinone oxidoreductase subunit J [Clostridium sp.]|nr:NADH-quinone oxidoreductase subunit J [Prevotella sp.]MCM1429433.1 NADH-quinone oxidoreductase subunit J [Clostridium sp.]MCM1475532.1 NADH-quinone oxidoreductase subunit J [Muribaculaceae bacterium]
MDAVNIIWNNILYFVVAVIIIFFSVMTVTSKKILRAATYLLFVLLGTAVFYFQLGYQFLGAVQIAVYAGGIMVLFVFAIVLTHKPDQNAAPLQSHRKFVGITCSVTGTALLLFALFSMPFCQGLTLSECLNNPQIDMHAIGRALVGTDKFQYLLPFEAVSVLLLACIIGGVTVARKK